MLMRDTAKFEFYRENEDCEGPDDLGDWRWRLIAKNGEILVNGEGYKNAPDMVKMLRKYVAHTTIQRLWLDDGLKAAGLTVTGKVRKHVALRPA